MLRSFNIKLVGITITLAVIIALLNHFSPFFYSFRIFSWLSLGFFFLLTILTGYVGFRALNKSPHGFVASVNGIVMIKLLLCVGFVLSYVLIVKPGPPAYITSFFAMYIIYSFYEIRELIMAQKKKSPEQDIRNHGNG